MNSLEKSLLLLKTTERANILCAHLLVIRSELDLAIAEVRNLQAQLQGQIPILEEP